MATVNENLIHTCQRGIVSYLNNRFSTKCRGNFYPPKSKEAPRSGRPQFPGPAFRRDETALAPVQLVYAAIRRRARRRRAHLPDRARLHAKAYVDLVPRYKEGS